MYVPLHVHTAVGSIKDSILKIPEYIQKGKELGLSHLAITDHGSMAAAFLFQKACQAADITPIIGMEAYEESETDAYNHLVLLASTQEGLENLVLLHNKAHIDNQQGRLSLVSKDMLRDHGKGIIALSACVSGSIPKAILSKNDEKVKELVEFYKTCFDEFYLEIQPGNFPDQRIVNTWIAEHAYTLQTPVVVTNDVHYLNPEDYEIHEMHMCYDGYVEFKDSSSVTLNSSSTPDLEEQPEEDQAAKKKTRMFQKGVLKYPDTCYYVMDETDLRGRLSYLSEDIINEAILNTEKIARSCTAVFDLSPKMPQLPMDRWIYNYKSYVDAERLHEAGDYTQLRIRDQATLYGREKADRNALLCLIHLGLEYVKRSLSSRDYIIYVTRAMKEFAVIRDLGYSGYFLVEWDIVGHAKDNGLPVGPGRGSVCGSLVAYLLGITDIDPIKNNLMFERFLDPDRTSAPDIDVDFAPEARDQIFEYIIQTYGRDNCAKIGNVGVRKPKSALHAAARLLGIEDISFITKAFPNAVYDDTGQKETNYTIEEAIAASVDLQEAQRENPELFRIAIALEGIPCQYGVHAAGMLISSESLFNKIPLTKLKNNDEILGTTLDMESVDGTYEKCDCLSLKTLDLVDKLAKESWARPCYLQDDYQYNDPLVWKEFGTPNQQGVFQTSGSLYIQHMSQLHPQNITQLANVLALLRGPCVAGGLHKQYIEILNGKQQPESIHPIYDQITKDTCGVLLYQEQIMEFAVGIGLTRADGYDIIKAIAKKKKDKIELLHDKFLQCCNNLEMDSLTVSRLWHLIEMSASYSFNKSHAVAYAILSYTTMWYKVHYPSLFFRDLLTWLYANPSRKKMIAVTVLKARGKGLKFALPSLSSDWEFEAVQGRDDMIKMGICAVPHIGEKAFVKLDEARHKADDDDLDDFIRKVNDMNVLKPLCYAGTFSPDPNEDADYRHVCEVLGRPMRTEYKFIASNKILNNRGLTIKIGSFRRSKRTHTEIFCGNYVYPLNKAEQQTAKGG